MKNKKELEKAWEKRKELRTECDKFCPEDKLRAECRKAYAEGDLVFINAVLKHRGNIKIGWKNWTKKGWECHLETGEVFKP